MHKRVEIALRIATSLFVFSGYLALASIQSYGILLILPAIIIIFFSPIGERIDQKYPGYQVILRAIQIAYACFIPLSYIALGLLLGVISLVVFIQAMLMIRLRNEREYYYIFMMSFFLLLAACVSAPEPMIAIAIFLFLISSIWSFILIRFKVEIESAPAHQPEIEPLSGDVVRLDKTANLFDAGLVGVLIGITLVAFVITSGLFLVIPRVEAGFLGSGDLTNLSKTGAGSDKVDVASGVFGLEDPSAVMYVKFPDIPNGQYPQPTQLYWRLFSLGRYDNATWTRTELTEHLEARLPKQPFEEQYTNPLLVTRDKMYRGKDQIRQEIYVDSLPEDGVPALHLVQQLALDRSMQGSALISWDMDTKDFSMKLVKQGSRAMNYVAWSEPPSNSTEDLRKAVNNYEYMNASDFRMLTYHDLLPETRQMVEDLIADAPTLYDQVKTVESYLSGENFTYTLAVPALPLEHPVDAFLNEVRRGHCERFATAMALMLRSQGIPARVVSGYRGGNWDESGASYIVRNSMAHLWVEVLFPEIGWVVFDPSPRADETDMAAMERLSMMYANYALRSKIFWYQNVIQFDRGIQLAGLRSIGLRILEPFQQLGASTKDINSFGRNWAGRTLLFVFMFTLLLFLLWSWRTRAVRIRYTLNADQKRALKLYWSLRNKLGREGMDCRGKTAEDLLRESVNIPWTDQSALVEILDRYNEVRFGKRTLGVADFQQLRLRLKKLRVNRPDA